MSVLNIEEWTSKHVSEWVSGLDESIRIYSLNFLNFRINGSKLLNIVSADLAKFGVGRVGDQLLLYDGIQHLRNELESDRETLQSLAVGLAVRCKNYRSELSGKTCTTIPTYSLSTASCLLDAAKLTLKWLTSYPFLGIANFEELSKKIIKHCFELAMSSQRDSFADNAIEEVQYLCTSIINLCEKLIILNDSLIIQPAAIDVITLRRRGGQDLGIQFESTHYNLHLISGVTLNSPAQRSMHLERGDEILQVNYQTVVGWSPASMSNLLYENNEVILTVKRRPRHATATLPMYLRPNKVPIRKNVTVSPIKELDVKKTESKTNAATRFWKLYPKTGNLVKRRASVTGTSPTETRPPVTFFEDSTANEKANNAVTAANARHMSRPPLDKAKSIHVELSDEILKVFLGDKKKCGEMIPVLNAFERLVKKGGEMSSPSSTCDSDQLRSSDGETPSTKDPPLLLLPKVDLKDSSEEKSSPDEETEKSSSSDDIAKHVMNQIKSQTSLEKKDKEESSPPPMEFLHSGYLHNRQSLKFGPRWTRFHATADKVFLKIQTKPPNITIMRIDQMKNLSLANEVHSRPYAFKFDYDGTTSYFAAESQLELNAWMRILSYDKALYRSFSEDTSKADAYEKLRRCSLPLQSNPRIKKHFGNALSQTRSHSTGRLNEGKPRARSNISSITITSLKRFNSAQIPSTCSSSSSVYPHNPESPKPTSFYRSRRTEQSPDYYSVKREFRHPSLGSSRSSTLNSGSLDSCDKCGKRSSSTSDSWTQTDTFRITLDSDESVV